VGTVEDLADALAKETLEAADEFNDPNLVDQVSGVILAQSQTLQEAFMTAVRVRISERAARAFLQKKIAAAKTGQKGPVVPTDDNPNLV
jgi:hypothetical protein